MSKVSIIDTAAPKNHDQLEIVLDHWQEQKKRMVIAVNLEDLHYVLVMVEPSSNGSVILYYFDPLGKPMHENINAVIKQMGFSISVKVLEHNLQNSCDSGPWIVAVASQFVAKGKCDLAEFKAKYL